jgi:cytochrome b subunit of formate dehydrogenase
MSTITALAFVALAITGLALIHETRLRRAAHNVACRLILALRRACKAHDHVRDDK